MCWLVVTGNGSKSGVKVQVGDVDKSTVVVLVVGESGTRHTYQGSRLDN